MRMPGSVQPRPKGDIWVKMVESYDGRLKFRMSFSPEVGKYFKSDTFFIEYDSSIDNVDDSILYIPVIANIVPVAWATGADIHLEALDRTFVNALGTIKGNINSSREKLYHVVGNASYNETIIDPSKGERWFCTEDEAVANGWKKADR